MNVYENLEFQKKKFPEIFRKYTDKNNDLANREVAQTYVEDDDINFKNEILIYCDNFLEILEDVLHINNNLIKKIEDEISDIDSAIITYSFEEKLIKDELGSSLTIYFPRPFVTKFLDIRLAKKINNNLLDKAVNIICLKELSLFDKMKLEKAEYSTIKNIDELREVFIKSKFSYNKSTYNKINKPEDDLDYIREDYEINISLEICHKLQQKDKITESQIYKISNICMSEFYNEGIKVLKRFIVDDNFYKNYLVTEIYLKYFKRTKTKIDEFVSTYLIDEIKGIYDTKTSNSNIYIKLLKSSIVNLDYILAEGITQLNKTIQDNVRKVS